MSSREDDGFTLVELLLAMAMSGIIISALFSVLIMTFRTTVGLAENAPTFGVQNSGVLGGQVAVNNDVQGLTRIFSADAANVTSPAGVVIAGALPCARPAADPSLGSDFSVVRLDYRDNNDVLHQVNYRFSTDALHHRGELSRYDCTAGPAAATILSAGLDSGSSPTVTTLCPSGGGLAVGSCGTPGGYRLSITTLTGRQYAVDGTPRIVSGSLTPLGAPTPSATQPLPQGVTMTDTNTDGFLDTVVIKYPSDPSSTCLQPSAWVTALPPSGSTAGAPIKPAVNTVSIPYTLPTSPEDTAAPLFNISFTPPAGCGLSPFTALAPIDFASPVLIGLQPTAGSTPDGKPDPGDSFQLTFSEPLDPTTVPAQVRLVIQNTGGHDRLFLAAVGGGSDLTTGPGVDLGTNGTYIPTGTSASYIATVTADNALAPTTLTVSIPAAASCDTGNCASFMANAGSTYTFQPGSGLHDNTPQQNVAIPRGTLPLPTGLFRMF